MPHQLADCWKPVAAMGKFQSADSTPEVVQMALGGWLPIIHQLLVRPLLSRDVQFL